MLKRYIAYLGYVLRHIRYVQEACFRWAWSLVRIGDLKTAFQLFRQGLTHDWTKFRPSEFFPYARFFYNKDGSKRQKRDKTGYYKPTDTGDAAFDFAWLLHQKRNRHHWQWWCLPEDDGGVKILEMPYNYVLEMVCDWLGAGRAQGFISPKWSPFQETRKWYTKNRDNMQLHPDTRQLVEDLIGWEPNGQ